MQSYPSGAGYKSNTAPLDRRRSERRACFQSSYASCYAPFDHSSSNRVADVTLRVSLQPTRKRASDKDTEHSQPTIALCRGWEEAWRLLAVDPHCKPVPRPPAGTWPRELTPST